MILKPTTIYVSLNGDVLEQSRTTIYRYSDINEIRLVTPLAVEGGMRVNFLLSNGVTIEQKTMTAETKTETVDGEEWNVWSYRPTNVITATLTAQSVTTLQLSFTQITVVEGRTFGNTFGTATLSVNPTIEGPEPTLEDATVLDELQTDITNLTTALGTKVDEDLTGYSTLTVVEEDQTFVYVYYNGGSYKVSLQQWIDLIDGGLTAFDQRLTFLEGSQSQAVGVGSSPHFAVPTVDGLTFRNNGQTSTIDYDDAVAINTIESHIDDDSIHFEKGDVTKEDVDLGNVDNTSDANKPVSTATQTALNGKQDTLVSGTNIKTLNNTSLLGSGNIDLGALLPNALEFKGTFGSAQSTTEGDLPATANTGDIYICDVASFASTNAGITFNLNDKALWDGTKWVRNAANDSVTSVNNKSGAVTLDKTDIGLENVANTAQVTAVTGTAPIVATEGTTPAISISEATTEAAGSMSATDKAKLDDLDASTLDTNTENFDGILSTDEDTVQKALDVLDDHTHTVADITDLSAATVTYDNTGQNLVATDVQAAINEIDDLVEEGLTQVVVVKYTITDADDGIGGFTYNRNAETGITGTIDNDKYIFTLPSGIEYVTGGNRLVTKIDASGGQLKRLFYGADSELTEPSATTFAVEFPPVSGQGGANGFEDNDVLYAKLYQSLATVSIAIADGAVTEAKLASDAVTTVKIANNNVTLAKVEQIATNTILGNDTGGTANVKALTASETKVLLALNNVDNTSDMNKPISSNTQTALDLKVQGPASAVNNQVATFDGTTGKLIKDSGFTIETSVPAGAVFTDTGEDNIIEIVQAEGTPLSITSKTVNVTRASLDAAQVDFYDTTIASADTWTLETGSYVLTKTGGNLTGLLSTDSPIIDIDLSSIAVATVPAIQSAWALVYRVQVTADTIKLFATDEPNFTADTPVKLKVVR